MTGRSCSHAAAERSRQRLPDGGHGALVSTRPDLEPGMARAEQTSTSSALIDPNAETQYLQEWLRQGGSGCLFAQNRAQRPDEPIYASVAMDLADLRSIEAVDELQRALLAALSRDAALIHLRAPTTAAELASALVAFGRSEHWYLAAGSLSDDPDHVLIKLRWPVPGTFVSSEVLGFADLESVPPTRRAPTTTLMLRTALPSKPHPTVHLAQMPYLDHEDDRIDFYWQGTRSARKALTPDAFHEAAQAPITYRLPKQAWEAARKFPDR